MESNEVKNDIHSESPSNTDHLEQGKEETFFPGPLTPIRQAETFLPTWGVILILISAFIILKSFIYIKDPKRHDK